VADGLVDRASGGELCIELGFADASEPEAITKEVLGLILGGDDDLEAVVFHLVVGVGYGERMHPYLIPVNIFFHLSSFIFTLSQKS
jgi:hypothetical protein